MKRRTALLAVSVLSSACDPYTRTTVFQMRNPSEVEVQNIAAPSHRLPEGIDVVSAEVARTEVATNDNWSSELIVTATRRPNGAIITDWQTHLPLIDGERTTLVDGNGKLTIGGHVAIDTTTPLWLTIPVCGGLESRSVKGQLVGYEVTPGIPCNENHLTQFDLETPTSNVASIDHVSTNRYRALGILGVVTSTLLFEGLGAPLTLGDVGDTPSQTVALRSAGVGMMLTGALLDGLLFKVILAKNKDEVIYPK
jgi:hypothetical protein